MADNVVKYYSLQECYENGWLSEKGKDAFIEELNGGV